MRFVANKNVYWTNALTFHIERKIKRTMEFVLYITLIFIDDLNANVFVPINIYTKYMVYIRIYNDAYVTLKKLKEITSSKTKAELCVLRQNR